MTSARLITTYWPGVQIFSRQWYSTTFRLSILIINAVILASPTASSSPSINLGSSLLDGQGACPGEQITFTCVTDGSASHAWASDEYIGKGGVQLQFAVYDSLGVPATAASSQEGTYAELIRKVPENETATLGILESRLHITVSSSYANASVTCIYVDTNYPISTTFQLLDIPEAPQGVILVEQLSNSKLKDSCFLHLEFHRPNNLNVRDIHHYIIEYQSGSLTSSDTSVAFTVSNCTRDLLFRVSAVNRCGMQGNSTLDIEPTYLPPTEGVATNAGDTANDVPVGLLVGLSIGILVFIITLLTIIVVVCCVKKYICTDQASSKSSDDASPSRVQSDSGGSVPMSERKLPELLLKSGDYSKVTNLEQNSKVHRDLKKLKREIKSLKERLNITDDKDSEEEDEETESLLPSDSRLQ